jgi:hypothetical protein
MYGVCVCVCVCVYIAYIYILHIYVYTYIHMADIAHCPSCSLLLRVIYDEEALNKLAEIG